MQYSYQQSMYGKYLLMCEVVKLVISIANFIRYIGVNHRKFRRFIEEMGREVSSLYQTEFEKLCDNQFPPIYTPISNLFSGK